MSKQLGPEKPETCLEVETFENFKVWLDAFATGAKKNDPKGIKFLLIIGKGGKGKTECVTAALEAEGYERNAPDGYGYANGKMTGINLYKFLYEYRDLPIVLDDVNALLKDPSAPSLLQAATETRLPRTIRYNSDARGIGDGEGETPKSFQSSSPIIIIVNEWNSANHIVKSIETRSISLYFNPSNHELHNAYIPTWFGKTKAEKEVYEHIGEWLEYIPSLNCRSYGNGHKMHHNIHAHWREELDKTLMPKEQFSECFALRLLNDDSYKLDNDRIKEFVKRGAGSVATFKRIKAQLGLSKQNRPTKGTDGRKERHKKDADGMSILDTLILPPSASSGEMN